MILTKILFNFFFILKIFFFSNKVMYSKQIFVYLFKKFNSVKKKFTLKDEFYFQFSFARNEQVQMIVIK